MSPSFDKKVFLKKFREEAKDHLKGLNQGLLALEKDPQKEEVLIEVMRIAHTLKGTAKMVGFENIPAIAHRMEDLLVEVKEKKVNLTREISDLLFASVDSIQWMLEQAEKGDLSSGAAKVCEKLDKARNGESQAKSSKSEAPSTKSQTADSKFKSNQKPKAQIPESKPDSQPRLESEQKIFGRRQEDKEVTVRVSIAKLDKLVNIVGEMVINQIRAQQIVSDSKEIYVSLKESKKSWNQFKRRLREAKSPSFSLWEEISEDLKGIDSNYEYNLEKSRELSGREGETRVQMGGLIEHLQEEILEARMLPLSIIFDVFPRAVRDLAKDAGKEINLKISGATTELDKEMLEKINDPLIHMLRNAVDHGIESPEQREKAGKPRTGTIEISASQEGDHVVVEMKDDGAGIDPQKIKERALKRGYLNDKEEKVEEISDEEALTFLFKPGFSTSSKVSDISGRGVGLDVVKKNIEKLKGAINLNSKAGEGTTFTLKLPLTLAISQSLLIKIQGQIFALSTTSVEEALKINSQEIQRMGGQKAIKLRNRTIPLVCLGEILKLGKDCDSLEDLSGEITVIVISSLSQPVGFVVDELVGEQETVVKALGFPLKRVKNIAGATILGSGEVALILHIPDLLDGAKVLSASLPAGKNSLTEVNQRENVSDNGKGNPTSILVVEDSLATRELEKNILESSGYNVDVAVDGVEALEKVGQRPYNLLVVDVQMPRLGGFELTKKVKQDPRFKEIPVVIVTTLEKEEDKKKGIEAGAEAYIVKSTFDQNNLLETVERLIG